MAIRFTIAQRGLLPNEKQDAPADEQWLRSLRPQLEKRPTVDAVKFQDSEFRLPSMLSKGELQNALDTLRRVMLHEMENGNAVSLPGIGTFRLSLKGHIVIKEGNERASYQGRDVCVSDILFEPDRKLLHQVRSFEVSQVPYGMAFRVENEDVEAHLDTLFAEKETITHKDLTFAFGQSLTRSRITSLLQRLVREGHIIREGKGAQTCYRKA